MLSTRLFALTVLLYTHAVCTRLVALAVLLNTHAVSTRLVVLAVVLNTHGLHLVQDDVQGARDVVHDVLSKLLTRGFREAVAIVQTQLFDESTLPGACAP